MTLHSKTRTPFDPADHTDVVSYDEASGETAIHRFDAMGELARTWWLVHESDGLYIAETSADQGEWRMTPTNWTAIHKIRLEALSTFAQLQYVVTEAVAFPLAVATWPGMIVSRWLRKRACDGAGVNVLSYSLWPRRRRLSR